jgi:glycosyltransferase involved in cell wall biosynthesis
MNFSVIIPVYNEEESLPQLLEELHAALDQKGRSFEIVLVDDGSTDGSFRWLEQRAQTDAALTLVKFRRNFGQTAAMQAGFDHARGDMIVTMDADLQNDPADIERLLEQLDAGYDLVVGWRAQRKDKFMSRRLPSMLANWLISTTTQVRLHDYGCTLKALRSEVAHELRLYGEMHRFIPAIASWMGVSVIELKVNHRPRVHGVSKYGIGRTTRVILDLITVRFFQGYLAKPMQVFGFGGLVCFGLGFVVSIVLAIERLVYHKPLADRPLLLLGVLLIVVGIQLLSLGLVADLLARTYFESQGKRSYHVRKLVQGRGHHPVAAPQGSTLPQSALS